MSARHRLIDGTGEAEQLRLPAVPIEPLDAVCTAAGTKVLPALAVLISALGWFLVNGFRRGDGVRVARIIPAALAHAIALHADPRGEG